MLNFCVGGALLGDPNGKLGKGRNSEQKTCLMTENSELQYTSPKVQNAKAKSKQKNGNIFVDGKSETLPYIYVIERQLRKCYSATLEICSVQFVLYEISMFFTKIVTIANFLFIDKLGRCFCISQYSFD